MFKVLIGIQARTNSQRFPNKMLTTICDKPMMEHVVDSCYQSAKYKPEIFTTNVVILTPFHDPLNHWKHKYHPNIFFQGDENDLVNRYDSAMRSYQPDALIRITGDEPLVPSELITLAMDQLVHTDYVSNCVVRTYYEGYDVQGCSRRAWDEFFKYQKIHREHPFREFEANEIIRDEFEARGFKWVQMINCNNQNQVHLSVDVPEDIATIENILCAKK